MMPSYSAPLRNFPLHDTWELGPFSNWMISHVIDSRIGFYFKWEIFSLTSWEYWIQSRLVALLKEPNKIKYTALYVVCFLHLISFIQSIAIMFLPSGEKRDLWQFLCCTSSEFYHCVIIKITNNLFLSVTQNTIEAPFTFLRYSICNDWENSQWLTVTLTT